MNKEELEEESIRLNNELVEIQKQQAELRKIEIQERKEKNSVSLDYLRDNKKLILSLFHHSGTSCSDENPINGYSYGYTRCKKCHLIEILDGDWGNEFEVDFDINITEIGE